eukprot:2031639-Pyramimonas_sp.AAC.1
MSAQTHASWQGGGWGEASPRHTTPHPRSPRSPHQTQGSDPVCQANPTATGSGRGTGSRRK